MYRPYPLSLSTATKMSSFAYSTVASHHKSFRVGSTVRDRYELLHRIGSGGSSTAWLVWDQQQSRYLSLKMKLTGRVLPCRCPGEATLLRLGMGDEMHPGSTILPHLFDDFILEADEAGTKCSYECIVMNVLGQSVGMMCHKNRISLPWDAMKQVVFYVLLGLDYLHTLKGVFHGDLNLDNILLGLPTNPDVTIKNFLSSLGPSQDISGPITTPVPNMDMLDIHLTDLDLAHSIHNTKRHSFRIQPEAFRAPEVILGAPWGPPVDIWNLGCLTYEMATSRSLFLPMAGISDELGQISRMVQFLGDFPPGLIEASSPFSLQYFESDGRFKHSVKRMPLEALVAFTLTQAEDRPTGPNISTEEIALFADFLRQTTCLDADTRASASDLLGHPWLDDILRRSVSKYEDGYGGKGTNEEI